MRALITGGKGFVGRWLERHLGDVGDVVTVIDLETDVSEAAAIGAAVARCRPEAIYHLAAMTHVGESWHEPNAVLRTNVIGTAQLLAAARQEAPEASVLVVSSAEVYGVVRAEQLPLHEEDPTQPVTPYAASKAAAEQVALQAFRGYAQRVIVVRPFNHIGPGQAPSFAVSALASRIVEASRAGQSSMPVGTITTRRDFTDVRDVVRAYRQLLEHGTAGEIYNVCSGVAVSIEEVADRLLALSSSDLKLVTDPDLLRPVDVPVLLGSAQKLEAVTGWKPEIPLDDTLRDVLNYWRERDTSPKS